MLPRLKEELLAQDDNLQDLRNLFLEADVDHSGSLSIDEVYNVIRKMGAELKMEELIELMNEIDIDRDGELDIDEFMALMNMGEELTFRNMGAKTTYLNIKKARKLNPFDFFKVFKDLPQNFVPSFIKENWVRKGTNLPSSVFKPLIDSKTMLYRDLLPVLQENVPPSQRGDYMPRLRPIPVQMGAQLLFE